MNRVYQMSKNKALNLLQLAKEQVPFGIYAIEKDKTLELRNDKCKSITQLKDLKRQFKKAGYRVYANGAD
ncbi:MAG: hypothetical protein K6G88_05700 [Lachnospiraceae bacterium]|nr:hypothetical protein [Lachnospiraceae bacterium]